MGDLLCHRVIEVQVRIIVRALITAQAHIEAQVHTVHHIEALDRAIDRIVVAHMVHLGDRHPTHRLLGGHLVIAHLLIQVYRLEVEATNLRDLLRRLAVTGI